MTVYIPRPGRLTEATHTCRGFTLRHSQVIWSCWGVEYICTKHVCICKYAFLSRDAGTTFKSIWFPEDRLCLLLRNPAISLKRLSHNRREEKSFTYSTYTSYVLRMYVHIYIHATRTNYHLTTNRSLTITEPPMRPAAYIQGTARLSSLGSVRSMEVKARNFERIWVDIICIASTLIN